MYRTGILFILLALGFFSTYYLLLLELPHRFIRDKYESDLSVRLQSKHFLATAALSSMSFILYCMGAEVKTHIVAIWLGSSLLALALCLLAIELAHHTLRKRFIEDFLHAWQADYRTSPRKLAFVLRQYNKDRVLQRRIEYVVFPLGFVDKTGEGTLLEEVKLHYSAPMISLEESGELYIRVAHAPTNIKTLLNAARKLPGFTEFRLLRDDEIVVVK